MIEKHIETYLTNQVKRVGGLCYKWVSPGNRGVPDRIVILHGSVYFVELKRPGETPDPLQLSVHRRMKRHGRHVFVLGTIQAVDEFIQEIIKKAR